MGHHLVQCCDWIDRAQSYFSACEVLLFGRCVSAVMIAQVLL